MGAGLTSFLFAIGCGTWVYSKSQKQTGGNTRTSLIAASVCGFIALLIFYTVFKTFLPK